MRKSTGRYMAKDLFGTLLLVFIDILIIFAASWAASAPSRTSPSFHPAINAQFFVLVAIITMTSLYFFDLYYVSKNFGMFRQLVNLIAAASASFLMLALLIFLTRPDMLNRRFAASYTCFMFILVIISRVLFSAFHRLYLVRRAIIIGDTPMGRALLKLISDKSSYKTGQNISIMGYLAENRSEDTVAYHDVPYLGPINKADIVIGLQNAGLYVYALHRPGGSSLNELLIREKLKGTDIVSAAGLYEEVSGRIPYEHMGSDSLIEDCLRGQKFTQARVKILFDTIFSAILLVLAAPILAISAMGIKLDSGGPVLFTQKRIGRLGKPFTIYKLRTMINAAERDNIKKSGWGDLYKENEEKISRWGRLLRKTHVDELPQLFNVLKGDMSLVGPRPEMALYVERCEKRIPLYRLRLAVRPGITGWAQISYVHTSTLSGYRRKIQYDLYYLKNMSFKLDLEIIIRTFFLLLGYVKR